MTRELKEESLSLLEKKETDDLILTFQTSADKLKLFVECEIKTPNKEINISKEDLLNFVPEKVSRTLLDENVFEQISGFLKKGQNVSSRRIAKGNEIVPGRDGKLLLLVKPYDNKSKKQEFVDPWYIKHFDLIEKNVSVARVYPPQDGNNGMDIFGQTLAAPKAVEVKFEIDQNLEVQTTPNNTYKNISSKESGYLVAQGNKLSISHDLNIAGDCDHQIGDLDFSGNIIIKGNIMKDFAVHAKGNIEVQGDVINGFITSSNGNVVIKGYVTGNFGDNLTSSGNITSQQVARFARKFFPQIHCAGNFTGTTLDNISLEADGVIEVSKEIKSSFIRTKTLVNIPQGRVIGGEIYTVCGLEAKVIGAESGTTTIINITSDIESSGDYLKILEKIKSLESAENLLRLYLGPYADSPEKIKTLKPDLKAKIQKMQTKLDEVMLTKKEAAKDKDELLVKAKYNHVYRVNSLEKIYPGVIIRSGEAEYKVEKAIDGRKTIEYFPTESRFEIGELKGLECSFLKQ